MAPPIAPHRNKSPVTKLHTKFFEFRLTQIFFILTLLADPRESINHKNNESGAIQAHKAAIASPS
jgi:hypothetical protein